jgi:modulator of FtsH protease HflK
MNDEHEHHDHAHGHPAPSPVTPDDTGSQALAEALRSSFLIIQFVMWVLVILFFCSGFFTVGPQEKAMILRFGKPVGEGQKALLSAGLHWSFPYPIDEVVKIPITEIQ